MTDNLTYDVVILGSGFGGSLVAAILGQAGLSAAVIDRQKHPRFAIGESSTPAADLILHDLANRYNLPELLPLTRFGRWRKTYPQILCGCKRGFTYFWHGDEDGFQPSIDHRQELFVAANASEEEADTQWYRPDVDHFLASVAQNHSAQLYEETRITAIDHPKKYSWLLDLEQHENRLHIKAEFLLDASGPAAILPRYLNLNNQTDQLQTDSSAVYSHWEGLPLYEDSLKSRGAKIRDYPYPTDDSAIHHLFRDGWAFQLRFANGLTSLGSVFVPNHRVDRNLPLDQIITRNRPALAEILIPAQQAPFPGKLYGTGRMQRLWDLGAGHDWAALPFTIGFIDPLHSTGIAHNLSGIERLSEILLAIPTTERTEHLGHYSSQVIQELRWIDLLIAGCYLGLADFRLFTAWSMVYFAMATSYEKHRLAPSKSDSGFLLAGDSACVERIGRLYRRLKQVRNTKLLKEQGIIDFQQEVKVAITPYNHVGLFEPEIPNMYRYTSAPNP